MAATKERTMRHTSFILALTLSPVLARADQPLHFCDKSEPVLAQAMLEADIVALARVEAVDEKNGGDASRWTYSWTTRLKLEQVWHGRQPLGPVTFEGGCSGHARMSRNHCGRPPGAKGTQLVVFLKKGADGKLQLAQPRFSTFGSCPDQSLVAKARQKNAALFKRILGGR
jgi:hypothetical protein